MEMTDFVISAVSLLRVSETRQLKNMEPWELEDGRFCNPPLKKSVWTSWTDTKKQRRWTRELAKNRWENEFVNWSVLLEDPLKSSCFSKHI